MTFFQKLCDTTQEEQAYLLNAPAIVDTFAGKISPQRYLAFLTQAYYHVQHTVPLLMAAGSRMTAEQEWLRKAVVEYIDEEYGHHEWILNDIRHAGGDAEQVRNSQPHFTTELMVAYVYDRINRVHPASFFGMVHVLEGTSVKLATQAAHDHMAPVDTRSNCRSSANLIFVSHTRTRVDPDGTPIHSQPIGDRAYYAPIALRVANRDIKRRCP